MRHSFPGRPLRSSARRAACTAGSMTLTAALLLAAAPSAQAFAALPTTGTTLGATATAAPAELAADTFARTVSGGWGTASVGGAWTTSGGSATYAVGGGAGTHRLGSGVTAAVFLNDVQSTDTDTRVDVALDRKAGSGAAAYASVLGRAVRGGSDYRARLVVTWGGGLELHVARGASQLARTALTDLVYGQNVRTTVRMQVTGTSPTTVRAKAWRTGTAEPAGWDLVTTDADPAMQVPGRVALSTYVSGGSVPVVASYSDLHVTPTVVPNVLPTASFGVTSDDLAVTLDASASGDPDGSVTSYAWDHGDGTTSAGRTSAHTYATAGTYRVALTVTDDRGGTATTARTVTAVAPNVAPLARFTAAVDDLSVALDASASSDSDGTLTSVAWDHGDGTTATGTTSTHVYAAPGTYPVTLTVTDDRGGRSTTTRTVTAIAPNVLPTAGFTADVQDLRVSVDASSSSDSDGTLESYRWSFGDGAGSTSRTATHTYATPGDYPVTLTVTDERGGTATTTRTVTAVAPNVLPTARFDLAADDLTVALDASGSTDPDGTVTAVRWDHGDGTTSTGTTARHTYAAPGDYTVHVTVTDDGGGSATEARTVTVLAPNVAPVAAPQVQSVDLRATLDATASSDADGTIASYRWDHGDGTTGTGATTTHTYAAAGTYTVTLTVTDDRGGTAAATRTVTAAAPRLAALHPFASSSVWNTGIGSAAQLEAKTDPRTANLLTATPTVNRAQWSIPVFTAKPTDVLGTLISVRDNKTYTFRIPANATGAAGSGGAADGHATIIQPDGVTSFDTYKLVKVNETTWEAQSTRVTDLRGSGTGAGVRAAGVPALAGLVRAHELRQGRIDHALAVAVPNSVLRSGWVFPAKSQDANGTTAYYGQVPMGSLIALPRSVDVDALPLSPEGVALARALQSYGGYVVDRAGTAALYCEVDCDPAATDRMAAAWRVLFKEMRIVSNSSATSVGGGGTPFVAPLGSVS